MRINLTIMGQMKKQKETLEEKIARVIKEHVALADYDPRWVKMFEDEREHLKSCLPDDLVKRIEHFGSTAVPNLAAKPIVDMLVEVSSLEETKQRIVPILEGQGYDYFWRPSFGDSTPPFYVFFIKRDQEGIRTHHIHMIERDFETWDRLFFRNYLIEYPEVAQEYEALKRKLSKEHQNDRCAYTDAKTDFIVEVTDRAKEYYASR